MANRWSAIVGAVAAAVLILSSAGSVAAQEGALLLTYDEGRFSVTNTGENEVSLKGLAFVSRDTAGAVARFEAASWKKETESLRPNECVQLVYGFDRDPVRPPECARLLSWRATRLHDQLFWLSDEEEAVFRIYQGSALLAVCPAGESSCAFELPADPGVVLVDNLLFYYTRDLMVVFNDAADSAPPLDGMVLESTAASPVLLHELGWDILLAGWDGRVLGPAQCLALYTGDAPPEVIPVRCEMVAQARLDSAPWLTRFQFIGSVLGRTSECLGARGDTAVICFVPQ